MRIYLSGFFAIRRHVRPRSDSRGSHSTQVNGSWINSYRPIALTRYSLTGFQHERQAVRIQIDAVVFGARLDKDVFSGAKLVEP